MKKSFAIIGMGRFGRTLAKTLSQMGCEVLCLDKDESEIQAIASHVTHAVVGDCVDENVLKSLGIANFDVVVLSMASDIQTSVLLTVMLKELDAKYNEAKVQSPIHSKILKKLGADAIVFPEYDMGVKIAYSLASTNFLDYIELSDGYRIIEVTCPKAWVGKSVVDLKVRNKYSVNILAVRHKDKFMVSNYLNHPF
jgi:trk system potassium uptake protein TrkA